MTFLEALEKEKKWSNRALLINLFHNQMLLRKKKWSMRKTSKKLMISLGQVSEGIKLANAILANPELEQFTREEVLRKIKL